MGQGPPGWWMPMSRRPAVTMMLPRGATTHDGSGKPSGWASGVPSASRHTRTEPSPPAITGLLSRSTPKAIALSIPVGILQRKLTEGDKIAQRGVIRCSEVPGDASGIVRDVEKCMHVTRCRSGLTGMVPTPGGYRRWRRSVLAIFPIGAR